MYPVKNIVLPILEEFKPDIIINSAGQDNHYTDPLTNMNFSAQGYAHLTAMLKPDIAVLEGGYSIEGALPYVNLGIVLAMAGVDYSRIKEPNYDPESIRQPPEVTEAIEKIGAVVLSIWQNRETLKDQLLEKTDLQKRTRTIFYDTDGILESQAEQIQVCPDCAGALRIDSSSDRGAHILAVHIPRKACRKCKDIGYRWYDEASRRQFDGIYLQDRTEDLYFDRQN